MLSKLDICDAFKLIPLSPGVWHLFGIKWKNLYYFYKRLVFGCRSSPKIFDQLSVAICWIAMNNYKVDNVFHLLDDFLAVDNASEKGYRTMAVLSMIFNKLNKNNCQILYSSIREENCWTCDRTGIFRYHLRLSQYVSSVAIG